ncbi:Panacea domain-containing protein [Devosia naphthalenivorans]|uniref:Panacea domain-containing protein n=1 Tax=Devosia naphthalenivorans TaxID=2082392 RepID=UPI000D381286|nr:type II toxin-antitoxin system antitoxin SocA domain-containing protein [Devosia naphthalenivorans]
MRTYHADDIADFFIARSNPEFGDLISNLKLQKLCYYAAGLIAAVREDDRCPLFADGVEAWQHGPVVPSQYRRFAQHGADNIPPKDDFDFSQFDANDLSVLDDVYNFYGQYSAWKLRNMTHEERPWLDAYHRLNKTITTSELREFFANEVSREYVESYRVKAA